MPASDILTTRIGDSVKVEIDDPSNPYGTVPNYGTVTPTDNGGYHWSLYSGQSGDARNERAAVLAAARAIREHAPEGGPIMDTWGTARVVARTVTFADGTSTTTREGV